MNYQPVLLLAGLLVCSTIGLSNIAYSFNITALPMESKLHDLSYPDWVVSYYRWIASIPEEVNHPILDKTGQSCSTYQNDSKIFYLVDAQSGNPVVRECTVPKDTPVLINLLYSTCDEKTDREDFQVQPVKCVEDGLADTHISFSIDGIPFDGKLQPDINKFKVEPIFFNVSYAKGNYLSTGGEYTPGKNYKSIIGAYVIILEPLPLGKHTIAFDVISGGCTENDPSCSPYHVNVKYNLLVI
jgi:hypothetical protein